MLHILPVIKTMKDWYMFDPDRVDKIKRGRNVCLDVRLIGRYLLRLVLFDE
jgi:hypothetical protein